MNTRNFSKSITVTVTEFPKPRQPVRSWNFGTWSATNRDEGFSYEPTLTTDAGNGTTITLVLCADAGRVVSHISSTEEGYAIKETAFTITCWRKDLVQAAVAYLVTLAGDPHMLSACLAALEAVAVNQGWWGTPADLGDEAAALQ